MIPEVEYLVDDVKTRQQQLGGLDSTKSAQDVIKLRRDTESLVKLLTEILTGSDLDDNTESSVEIMRQWLHDVSGSRLRRRRQQDVYTYFSDSEDDESRQDDEEEEWIDEDALSSTRKSKSSIKRRGMEQYLDLLPSVRAESSDFVHDKKNIVVRHCARCTEKCDNSSKTCETS